MKASKYILVILGLFVLAAVLATRGEPPTEPAPTVPGRDMPVTPVAAAAPSAPATPPTLAVPSLLAPAEEIPGEEGEHGEFTTSTDIIKQKIFKREPALAQLDYFRQHVLLDSRGRADYQTLLADKAILEQTRRALLYPRDAHSTMESNIERLMRIDHLREALAWKENPERQHLLSVVEGIILEDSFGPMMPLEIKRTLAASKTELYQLLYDQDPERALALVQAAKHTRLEKMLEHMAQRNQNRLAKQRELSLQAQAHQPQLP